MGSLVTLGLFLALGSAAALEDGVLRVSVNPGTEVQSFRVVKPGHGHLMVSGCEVDLGGALSGRTTEGILELDVVGVGHERWYFRVQLDDADRELVARLEEGELVLTTRPRVVVDDRLELLELGVEQLLSGEDLPQAADPPALPMMFLHGEALLPAVDPTAYEPLLPVYAPGVGPGSWATIDDARETFLESGHPRERAHAAYALGWNYLELGFTREAEYYFDQLPSFDGIFDPEVIAMTRARVSIMLGAWEQARQHLEEGWASGASPEQVLESLALVSLETGSPPATATAHALLSASGRPEAWLLAAELLQRDNHFQESILVLQGLESRVPPEQRSWVSLRLGDALLATQDLDGANKAYARAPEELKEVRRLHTALLHRPSTDWPRIIPPLRELASGDGAMAAEALYLLAQVNTLFGETTSAMEDLKELEERFPRQFGASDAPDRQLDLYFGSLEAMHRQLRWLDIASTHRQTWSRELLDRTDDYRPLLLVADAFEALGLPEEARRVLGDAFYVLSTGEGDDPVLVFRLAELYAEAGRNSEALETLDYLGRHELPAEYRGRRSLLRARILDATGDGDAALNAYMAAARHPDTRDEAQIQLALRDADAGRCKQAIPSLQRLLMPSRKLSRISDPLPFLALARCLMAEGREAEAAAVAREAAGRIESPADARHAEYIGVGPATDDGPAAGMSRAALLSERDIWAILGQEDLEAAAFRAEVEARRED
jgi:predicted negative regulator of RcsB-dependent stress response